MAAHLAALGSATNTDKYIKRLRLNQLLQRLSAHNILNNNALTYNHNTESYSPRYSNSAPTTTNPPYIKDSTSNNIYNDSSPTYSPPYNDISTSSPQSNCKKIASPYNDNHTLPYNNNSPQRHNNNMTNYNNNVYSKDVEAESRNEELDKHELHNYLTQRLFSSALAQRQEMDYNSDVPLDLSMKTEQRRQSSGSSEMSEESGLQLTFNDFLLRNEMSWTGKRIDLLYNQTSASNSPSASPVSVTSREQVVNDASAPYTCLTCGEKFTYSDRLAKHVASRHRVPRAQDAPRAYRCTHESCNRSFTRSDMLTRHARLHSGVKPYSCSICFQVFTRSDHLATHQRTHTGEKPYKCPACPYAACRRDMITRHMRTHSRQAPAQYDAPTLMG